MTRICLLVLCALLVVPSAALAQSPAPDSRELVPLRIGTEWHYRAGEHDPNSGDAEYVRVLRVTGTTEVEGAEWFRVEEMSTHAADGAGEPRVWYARNAPEGFYEFYGGDLSPETLSRTVLYKYPAADGEVYVARSGEDWGDEFHVHVLNVMVGGREATATCYTRSSEGFDPEWNGGTLMEGECFVPGIGRVVTRHEFGGSHLVAAEGGYSLAQ